MDASFVQASFLGGEVSQLAQGRIDLPEYRTRLNICLNGHPIETGAWVRRPGTAYADNTRSGVAARVLRFDFEQATPYTVELTDGTLRFRAGSPLGGAPGYLALTNDEQPITAISAANPAVVTAASAHGWSTGNTIKLFGSGLTGGALATLQNRQLLITVTDSAHFSIADAITGNAIDGSTLGALPANVSAGRIYELTSPYVGGSWSAVRAVQAENTMVTLLGSVPPNLLTVTKLQNTQTGYATFSLAQLTFLDGPYLDPFTNGVQALPNAKSGNITLTLQFPAYSSTQAYQTGTFVTSSSVNYESLIDNNVNNTPASSPSDWAPVSAGAAINNGQGFLATDVGRLVRLFSEPAGWLVGTTYATGNIVAYNPSGIPGASTYWTALGSTTGNIPGNDTTHWTLTPANAALWSWGRITGLTNAIAQATGTVIGNMTGKSNAFNSTSSQSGANSANDFTNSIVTWQISIDDYVGKNFTGGAQAVSGAVIYPSSDKGFTLYQQYNNSIQIVNLGVTSLVFNLRGKSTAPSSASDGTLLGTSGNVASNNTLPVSIVSTDQATTWNYVWIEVGAAYSGGNFWGSSFDGANLFIYVSQVYFQSPAGTGISSGVTVELLGPPLLYTTPISTWRLGVYSATTGYPTNGCYHEGRLWLAGAVANRFDAGVSNGLSGDTINFAPTDQDGVVGDANGISYTLNSDGVNPIVWMMPDLQGVIMGTQAGEWLTQPPTPGPMTPSNIASRRVTKIGGTVNIPPVRTEHTVVFVKRYGRKVMEYFADVYSGKFSAPNLSEWAMHITKPGVAELAYTEAVTPILWGRNADGSWWGCTYKRDTLATSSGPTFAGFHRHVLGSGRTVTSVCSGPSTGGDLDALTMVTFDGTTGVYHVEIMTDVIDEGETLADAAYLDDAIQPTSTISSNTSPAPYGGLTLNGLWPLNGKTVTAWLGGLDCGDYTVANGSITVPYGDGVSAGTATGLFTAAFAAGLAAADMLVGFTFTSQAQIVRPATPQESGARSGPAPGKKRRAMQYAAQLEGTQGISFGTTFGALDPAQFRQPDDTAYAVNKQFTGVHWDTLTDDYGYDSMLAWQVSRPYIANVALVQTFLETMDK